MNYKEYLHIQRQVERLYDFHAEIFDHLTQDEIDTLRAGFLYDIDDGSYPRSIEEFYKTTIEHQKKFQSQLFTAAQHL